MDEFEVMERLGVPVGEIQGLCTDVVFVRPHGVGLLRAGMTAAERELAGRLLLEAALQHLGSAPAI